MAQDIRKLDTQEGKEEQMMCSTAESFSESNFEKEMSGEEEEYTAVVDEEVEVPKVPIYELRKVRAEAAKYRKQLRQLESRIDKDQKAAELTKMEETDRLKAIAAESENKAKFYRRRADDIAKRAAIINAASVVGFYNPKDAASIIDLEHLEVDDDGNIDEEKINELVKQLAESRPYLVKKHQDSQDMADFGPTNPASEIWPKPKFRTKDQIDRLKQQSNEAMRSGRVAAAVKLYNQAWEMERGIIKKPKGG